MLTMPAFLRKALRRTLPLLQFQTSLAHSYLFNQFLSSFCTIRGVPLAVEAGWDASFLRIEYLNLFITWLLRGGSSKLNSVCK